MAIQFARVMVLLAGYPQQALDYAEQAMAARYSERLHRWNFARERRADTRAGRWHNSERFWIDWPAPKPVRLTFRFLALYDEQGGRLREENAQEIEQASGIEVDVDGWRQLITLLTRFGDGEGSLFTVVALIRRSKRVTLFRRLEVNGDASAVIFQAQDRRLAQEAFRQDALNSGEGLSSQNGMKTEIHLGRFTQGQVTGGLHVQLLNPRCREVPGPDVEGQFCQAQPVCRRQGWLG